MALFRSTARALAVAAAALIVAPVNAARLDYAVGLGLEHNDNITQSETNPQAENILEPLLGFLFTEEGSTVQARVDGALQYRDYLNGIYGNELRSQLGGHVNWVALPERLSFVFDDYLGEQPVNTLAANTPNNLQRTNVFSAGPTLAFRISPSTRGLAELRYFDSYAQRTDEFDSQRGAAALRIIRDLSPISQLSGNLQAERIEPTHSDGGPAYTRYSAYAHYGRTLRLLDFTVDLGYSWLNISAANKNPSKPLLRANLNWRPSDRSTFSSDLAYQYTDAASSLIQAIQGRGGMAIGAEVPTSIAPGNAVVSPSPYLEQRISLTYAYADKRLTFSASPFYAKLNYVIPNAIPQSGDVNQTNRGGGADLGWLLRPDLTIGVAASLYDTRYPSLERTDKNRAYGAYLRQQWNLHWSWRLELDRNERRSTAPGQDSNQNIIYLAVIYTR